MGCNLGIFVPWRRAGPHKALPHPAAAWGRSISHCWIPLSSSRSSRQGLSPSQHTSSTEISSTPPASLCHARKTLPEPALDAFQDGWAEGQGSRGNVAPRDPGTAKAGPAAPPATGELSCCSTDPVPSEIPCPNPQGCCPVTRSLCSLLCVSGCSSVVPRVQLLGWSRDTDQSSGTGKVQPEHAEFMRKNSTVW